jgi:hypothetical protein
MESSHEFLMEKRTSRLVSPFLDKDPKEKGEIL